MRRTGIQLVQYIKVDIRQNLGEIKLLIADLKRENQKANGAASCGSSKNPRLPENEVQIEKHNAVLLFILLLLSAE